MTRERIKDFKEIVLPFFTNYFLKKNYENLGKSDAEEFKKDFNEIIELADKALEQEPILDKIRAEIIKYEGDCRLSVDEYPSCKQCTDNVFGSIYAILDKYKAENEDNE